MQLSLGLDRADNRVELGIGRHPFERPRAQGANVEALADQSLSVAALMHTEFGLASAWIRAAIFGVSPMAWSMFAPPALIAPTTTRPVWIPTRASMPASPCAFSDCVQLAHARRDGESGQDGSLGVVVVRAGIAEKSDGAVADVLVDVAAVAGDALVADALVGAQHVAQCLGVQVSGERRRTDNVGEQHRQLATLAIR